MEIKASHSPATCPETAQALAPVLQGKWACVFPLTQQAFGATRVGMARSRSAAGRWGSGERTKRLPPVSPNPALEPRHFAAKDAWVT